VDEEGVVAARVALRFFGGELILDGFQGFLEAGRVDERQEGYALPGLLFACGFGRKNMRNVES